MISRIPKEPRFKTKLLFVHGAWHGAWCWKNFMDYFSKAGFSCWALDLPCHGEKRDEPGLAKQRMADYVEAVDRAAREIGNPVVIAHSMGGFVTMKYLERAHPPAAVLVAPLTYRHFPRSTLLKMTFQYPITALRFFSLMPLIVTSERMYRRLFLYNAPGSVSREGFGKAGGESSLALMAMGIPLVWLRPRLVKTPVLLLASGHDYFFPVKNERKTARAYGADSILYEDMGHNLMSEDGWEKVAGDILEWLKKRIK